MVQLVPVLLAPQLALPLARPQQVRGKGRQQGLLHQQQHLLLLLLRPSLVLTQPRLQAQWPGLGLG